MTRTLVVLSSGNSKLGRVTATYRTQDSCPTECAFYAAGCYARGRIFAIPAKLGTETDPRYLAVRQLANHPDPKQRIPDGGLFRANVSGDILDDDGTADAGYLAALSYVATERPDVDVFTYTHAWRRDDVTPDMAPGVTVNASCETADDLAEATAAGWPTVVTDSGDPETTLIGQTIAGRRVVQCPQQTRGITCDACRLCVRPQRRSTVAFVTHGGGKAQAARAIDARRALPVFSYPEGSPE